MAQTPTTNGALIKCYQVIEWQCKRSNSGVLNSKIGEVIHVLSQLLFIANIDFPWSQFISSLSPCLLGQAHPHSQLNSHVHADEFSNVYSSSDFSFDLQISIVKCLLGLSSKISQTPQAQLAPETCSSSSLPYLSGFSYHFIQFYLRNF